jgi:sugar-specific transcriptional regulator TrmB
MRHLAGLLRLAGLEGTEAEVYLHLLETQQWLGPTDIRDATGTSRQNATRILDELAQRGFVLTSVERPVRYYAVDPTQVFSHRKAHLERSLRDVEEARVLFAIATESLQKAQRPPSRLFQRALQGRAETMLHVQRLVRDAKTSIRAIITRPNDAPRLGDVRELMSDLARRAEEGLRVEAILSDPEGALPPTSAKVAGRTTPVRVLAFIIDDEQALLWIVHDPAESPYAAGDVALHTNAPGIVQVLSILVETLSERT